MLQRISQKAGVALPGPASADSAGGRLDWLRGQLPEGLRPHLLEVIEKADEWVLFVDSAAWAGRLKLALAEAPLPGGRRAVVRVAAPGTPARAR